MAIRQGTAELSGVYIGGNPVQKIYQGSNLVYTAASTSLISLADLQFYFPFNGTVTDDSGNANTTTQVSTTFGTGKFGDAAVINAQNANSTILTSKVWGTANAYSLAAWVNLVSLTGDNQIITRDASFLIPRCWQFRSVSGQLQLIRFNASGGVVANFSSGASTISAGVWIHVAATFDTTNGSKLYINGVQVGSDNNLTANNDTASKIGIGTSGDPNVVSGPLNGSIDEAIMYSRALTAGEITTLAAGTGPLI